MKIHKLFYAGFIQVLMVGTAFASPENPSFKDNILTVLAVDSDNQAGKYQDVRFQLTEEGEWKLLDYKTIGLISKAENGSDEPLGRGIQEVEIITTDAYPIQAFLKVSAKGSGCLGSIGQINQKLVGNSFEVFVYHKNIALNEDGTPIDENGNPMACVAGSFNISKIIELSIYDLPAGEYTYNVNGDFSGSFNLTSNNGLIELGY